MKRFLLSLTPLFLAVPLFAQDATDSPAGDDAANAAGALAALGCGILPCILGIAIQLALAFWVYKDATKRGMENAVLLTIVTALTGLIGLLIYLLMRPKTPPPGVQ
jgi:hypothetical protein